MMVIQKLWLYLLLPAISLFIPGEKVREATGLTHIISLANKPAAIGGNFLTGTSIQSDGTYSDPKPGTPTIEEENSVTARSALIYDHAMPAVSLLLLLCLTWNVNSSKEEKP